MQDIKIGGYKLNSRDELVFKITCKAGDYTPAELQLIKNAEVNGDMLDLQFTGLTNGDKEQNRKSKIQRLVFLMQTYCEKSNSDIEQEKQNIYIRNKIKSRSELTLTQLDFEIDLYNTGLIEFN